MFSPMMRQVSLHPSASWPQAPRVHPAMLSQISGPRQLGQNGDSAGTIAVVVIGIALLGVLAYSMDLLGGK